MGCSASKRMPRSRIHLFDLPDDIWNVVFDHTDFEDTSTLRLVHSQCESMVKMHGRVIAQRFATACLGDDKFWIYAQLRPKKTSRPLCTWHSECVRIAHFCERTGTPLDAKALYGLWKVIDAFKGGGRLPQRL